MRKLMMNLLCLPKTYLESPRPCRRASENEFVPRKSISRMVFFSFIITLPLLTPGMTGSFSGIALPQLELDLDESSWFASISSITCPIGCLVAGFLINVYGGRAAMVCGMVPDLIGWFLMVDANASFTQLCIGRLLTGFTEGASSLPCMVYAAECITINHPQIRSSVGTWCSVTMSIGCLIVYALGALLPYNQVALVAGCLSTLSVLLVLIFLPESPTWLYRKGRIGDAELAQRRLGIKQPILHASKIRPIVPSPETTETSGYSLSSTLRCLGQLRRREVYKPLAISIGFLFFAQFSGLYCVLGYMVELITVRPLEANSYVLALISGILHVVGGALSVLIMPYAGVRMLSIASFAGVAASFALLALSSILEDSGPPNVFNYLHVISIWTASLSGYAGMMTIPYTVLAEIFPAQAKGFAGLSLFASSVFNFIVLKIFPYAFDRYRNAVFFVFAAVCAGGSAFVALWLPETVGRTMDEIQEDFKRPKKLANANCPILP